MTARSSAGRPSTKVEIGRLGTPEDAANLVAFLWSDRGGWFTGQVIRADGGWSSLGRER